MNHNIYPLKSTKTKIIIKPKQYILNNEMCKNNKHTNIYIKYKKFIDSALEKIKTNLADYNKIKIYKGKWI